MIIIIIIIINVLIKVTLNEIHCRGTLQSQWIDDVGMDDKTSILGWQLCRELLQ